MSQLSTLTLSAATPIDMKGRAILVGRQSEGALGFTLIEVLISMTLGLLVLVGVSTIVVNTGRANREQSGLARMQENGRYALGRISADLRMAGAQYCGSLSSDQGSLDGGFPLRAMLVNTDAILPWGLPSRATIAAPVPPTGDAWGLSPRYFIQGHECTTNPNCVPNLSILGSARPIVPTAGTIANRRASGADVLTLRYLADAGITLAAGHPGGATPLSLSLPIVANPGDLFLVSDCKTAEVFSGVAAGNLVTPTGNSSGNNKLDAYEVDSDARVFNFTQGFRTVSYFLQMRANQDGGSAISTLARQQNGQTQQISDGVERLDFLYGVRTNQGDGTPRVQFLTADQVQNGVAGLACLRKPTKVMVEEVGCLWRQVESIDVSLLLNTVTNTAPTENELFTYSAAVPPLANAVAPATLPSGLPRGRMFRREFRTRVNVSNFTQ